jgi:hypothetical protein
MSEQFTERRAADQIYRIWHSEQVIAINMDDSNNAILHTGSRVYDTYSLALGYGTVTNNIGSYYHEFVDFKNVSISSPFMSAAISLPTADGWTQEMDNLATWKQNGFVVTITGSANVTTRNNSPLPTQAAPLVETPIVETVFRSDEMPLAATAFEMALQSENVLPLDAIVPSNETPITARYEKTFGHDHWDDNWYALLAELHLQEQRKKDKWHGEDDDWLTEFEKLALLDLRK